MMGWAFNSKKPGEQEENTEAQADEDNQDGDDEQSGSGDDQEVQGINLGETELPRKSEKYSKEMYEELEQRVVAF